MNCARYLKATTVVVLLLVPSIGAFAGELPKNKQTKAGLYLTASEAGDMLKDDNVLFVDIRSRAEVSFLGLPTRVNVHIPYMEMPLTPEYDAKSQAYKLELNPDFPLVFKKYVSEHGFGKDSKVVLMCRSGSRSAKAADLLTDMGYKNVYSLVDGYEGDKVKDGPNKGKRLANGWKNTDLAWSYKIDPEQLYPEDKE
jgi:rhodanese-related sulfurtransferase